MSLTLYDDAFVSITTDPLRFFLEGHAGGSQEKLFYIRNHAPQFYYTNATVQPVTTGAYDDAGEFGATGWGVKVMYGKRRPTEAEWDRVRSGDAVVIPDIGSTQAADTFTNHPIWVRYYCPGDVSAQIRENTSLRISYYKRNVGA